jgi:hypothetical protein
MRFLSPLSLYPACIAASLFLLTNAISLPSAVADTRIYTLDPAESSITLSGTVTSQFGTAPIEQQGPGSLTTSYTGTIHADRTSSTIQFLSGGSIDANVSGSWQPLADASAGSAPADYGARVVFAIVVVNFAGRDLVADLTGFSTPVDGSGNFDLANSDVNFTSGNIAYRANFGLAPGTETLAGRSGNLTGTATLTTEGMTETLLLPVSATFNIPVDANTSVLLTLDGQLVATAPLPEELPGDFNLDGSVDAADYVVWSKGAGVEPTEENYNLWRTNFGRIAGGAGAAQNSAVPEPASVALVVAAVALITWNRRHQRRIA